MNNRLHSTRGMTMAEVLLTVAIILILAGLAFVAVITFQRSMAQKERDGYAKEIFIAAQNHLSLARGEGYLQVTEKEGNSELTPDEREAIYGSSDGEICYFTVPENTIHDAPSTILDLMLPFGSVDEKIRAGSYIICYQPEIGKVLDVFYCSMGSGKFDHTLVSDDYDTVKNLRDIEADPDANPPVEAVDNKGARRNVEGEDWNGAVLGWYGGADLEDLGTPIENPIVSVENGDKLKTTITYKDDGVTGYTLKLLITGTTKSDDNKNAKKAIKLDLGTSPDDDRIVDSPEPPEGYQNVSYVLDSVTDSGMHFIELGGDSNGTGFIAGEDIEVKAVAYSNSGLCNIGYSEAVTVNSLYQSISMDVEDSTNPGSLIKDPDHTTAFIGNIRHLENLEEDISATGTGGTVANLENLEEDISATGTDGTVANEMTKKIKVTTAKQTDDLVCSANYSVYKYGSGNSSAHSGYYPIMPDDLETYDGLRHSISKIELSAGVPLSESTSTAGLFAAIKGGQTIENIELIDFDATSGATYCGTLAGSMTGGTVSNVIAHNSNNTGDFIPTAATVTGTTAGGLIGGMTGGTVKYSGAALVVGGTGNAGGLIGSATGDTTQIKQCYSGGHTVKGSYEEVLNDDDDVVYNVTSSDGNAGGLVGDAGAITISNSYSTCSASGSKSGGLIGKGSSTTFNNCYCTGLVNGDKVDVGSGTASGTIKYLGIINLEENKNGNLVAKEARISNAKMIDESAATFNDFTGGKWNEAKPYDTTLAYINSGDGKDTVRYSFNTVTQLLKNKTDSESVYDDENYEQKNAGIGAYFVNTHYGDWPAPEAFLVNKK